MVTRRYLASLTHGIVPKFVTIGLQSTKCLGPILRKQDFSQFSLSRVFNDPIHGHIEFHPLCVAIIDTPQFQRLRYIKQLGAGYFVFPGASHNRFEHSLGVGHLAGELVRKLRDRQPELDITKEDELCVEIAGLCHDLGHGPFSHMFDNRFMPQCGKTWKHEEISVKMFQHLIKANNLMEQFKSYNLKDHDIKFIEEQIAGPTSKNPATQEWQYHGRTKEKCFLYEIVANKRNGIDVDKWDYFARDCHHLGIRNIFDHRRFMQFARVIEVEGTKQICSRDKEVGDVYDMFYTRNALHRRAYQHKTCVIIEYMINEALLKAKDSDHLKFPGKDGQMKKLLEAVDDMEAYTLVHDGIYHQIRQSTAECLKVSRQILEAIERRQLYKCIGQSKPREHNRVLESNKDEEAIGKGIIKYSNGKLEEQDVIVQFCRYDYGNGKKDPIDEVYFYSKKTNNTFKFHRDEVSRMTPEIFSEIYVRVYSRRSDRDVVSTVRQCFERFCEDNDFISPKGGDPGSDLITAIGTKLDQ